MNEDSKLTFQFRGVTIILPKVTAKEEWLKAKRVVDLYLNELGEAKR